MPNGIRIYTEIQAADDFAGPAVDGGALTWDAGLGKFETVAVGGGTPGGSDGEIQFNDDGAFGGAYGITYDSAAGARILVTDAGDIASSVGKNIIVGDATALLDPSYINSTVNPLILAAQDSNSYLLTYYGHSSSGMIWANFIEDGGYGGDVGSLYFDGYSTLDDSAFSPGAVSFSPFGRLGINVGYAPVEAGLQIRCGDAALPGLLINMHANTTDALQFKNASDAIQFAISTDGKIKTNQATANTNPPSGATAKKLAIYDTAGALLGYVPVYGSAW